MILQKYCKAKNIDEMGENCISLWVLLLLKMAIRMGFSLVSLCPNPGFSLSKLEF
jgi:hypothetical protein